MVRSKFRDNYNKIEIMRIGANKSANAQSLFESFTKNKKELL